MSPRYRGGDGGKERADFESLLEGLSRQYILRTAAGGNHREQKTENRFHAYPIHQGAHAHGSEAKNVSFGLL